MRKTAKILFTISVLVNVIVIGTALGFAVKHHQNKFQPMKDVEFSPEGRNIVARSFRSGFKEMKPVLDKARTTSDKLVAIFEADEFDEEAFDAIAQELYGYQTQMMKTKIETVKRIGAALSAEERAKMSKMMVSSLMRGKPHHKKQGAHVKRFDREKMRAQRAEGDGEGEPEELNDFRQPPPEDE